MKELTIIPPKGYEIDKEKSTFEKIIFKPIDTKPRSWKEYWKNNFKNKAFLGVNFVQGLVDDKNATFHCNGVIHQIPMSIELAEAFLAMMQLMSLRQEWIGDWKPNLNGKTVVYTIVYDRVDNTPVIEGRQFEPASLFFPTIEMTQEFLNCFKDLLEQAKILL